MRCPTCGAPNVIRRGDRWECGWCRDIGFLPRSELSAEQEPQTVTYTLTFHVRDSQQEEEPQYQENVKKLLAYYPQEMAQWTQEQLEEEGAEYFLEQIYDKDPQKAIAMWRSLAGTNAPLTEESAAEGFIFDLMESIWLRGIDDPWLLRPLLDLLQKDEAFARQLFQSAFVSYCHQAIIVAAWVCGREELARHLADLLEKNPLPREKWDDDAWEGEDPLGPHWRYCTVRIPGVRRYYSYLAGDLSVKAGDWVEVPFGDGVTQGEVRSVECCSRPDAPWPPEETKFVLRILEKPPAEAREAPKVEVSQPAAREAPPTVPEVPKAPQQPAAPPKPPAQPPRGKAAAPAKPPKKSGKKDPAEPGGRKAAICILLAILFFGSLGGGLCYLWDQLYDTGTELLREGQYAASAERLKGVPSFMEDQSALLQLARVGALAETEAEASTQREEELRQGLQTLDSLTVPEEYQEKIAQIRPVLSAQLEECIYTKALSMMETEDYRDAVQTLQQIQEYQEVPTLLHYAKACSMLTFSDMGAVQYAAEELAQIPEDYGGPYAEEITAVKARLPELFSQAEALEKNKQDQIEKKQAERKALEARWAAGPPCVDMPEDRVNSTKLLGKAGRIASPVKRVETSDGSYYIEKWTVYTWYSTSGNCVFEARCKDGVVVKALKYGGTDCWSGDKLLVKLGPDPISFGHSGSSGSTGSNSDKGHRLRDEYDDPEDLYEDGWYDDLDEAWDDWEEG